MQPFHAVVKNGRLTLDTPSTLPEGQVVVLLPLEELMTLVDDAGDEGEVTLSFAPAYPPVGMAPREFKKPKAVTAASIIDELKNL
jgi:hypothetical protein